MLSEALQIFGFVRFVATRIGSAIKWLRRPRQEKLPRNRRVITTKEFEISRTGLRFRSYRLEECGSAAPTRRAELPLPSTPAELPATIIGAGLSAPEFEVERVTQEQR
jgi:hypothetical protein